MTLPVKVGVSACLLGEHVRYDGGQKCDLNVIDILGNRFSFVPVCPEVGCGLPTPREAMRLEGDPDFPRLVTVLTRVDMTERMLAYCAEMIRILEREELSGFIFKERSPSCGLTAVPLYSCGSSEKCVAGLFAKAVAHNFPLMPVVEAERLTDPAIRENFIESVLNFLESP